MPTRKTIVLELDVYVEEYDPGEFQVSLMHSDLEGSLRFKSFDEAEIKTILDDVAYVFEPSVVKTIEVPVPVVKEVIREVEVIKEIFREPEPVDRISQMTTDIKELKTLFGWKKK